MMLVIWFWLVMFLLLLGVWKNYVPGQPYPTAWSLLVFLGLLILGWQVFGAPVR